MLLALASGLESGEESYGEKAEEGTTQGDPLSGSYFCVVIYKLVRKAELILRNSVGMVRYGWDNGTGVRPKGVGGASAPPRKNNSACRNENRAIVSTVMKILSEQKLEVC